MNDDKKIMRRKMLKTTAVGSLTGLLVAFNPIKLFSSHKKNENVITKVKIHPLAIKRNNKDKS